MASERVKGPGLPADPERTVKATLDRIVRESLHILKADRSALFLHRPSTDSLQVEASFGLSREYLEAVSESWKALPFGRFLRAPGFFYSRDARSDPLLKPVRASIETEGFRSIAVVPLVSEDHSLGSLCIYFDEIRGLSPGEKSTIQTFADLAAMAIENAEALEEIRVRSERQEALRRVNQHLTENLDLKEVFTRICESVYDLLEIDVTHLHILDESSGGFNLVGAFGDSDLEHIGTPRIPKGKSLSHRVAAGRKPITVREILDDPDLFNRDWAEKNQINSYLGIPLILEDSVVGMLNCFTREVREFSAEEIDLAGVFATQAAVALKNAHAFEEVNRKSAQLSRLNEINRKLTSAYELDEILDSILEGSKELVGGRYAVCYLYDEARRNLFPHKKALSRFARGADFPDLAVGQGLVGWAAKTREPLVVPKAQKDPRWMPAPWNEKLDLGSFAGIPLISREVLLGVLAFFAESEDRLREGGLELLEVFADQAAIAVEKARQVESLKTRIAEQEGLAGALHHIPSGLRVEEVIEAVLAESERVMGTDRCSVMLPAARSGRPHHFVSRGISSEFIDRLSALRDPFPVGHLYLENPGLESPTVIHDVDAQPDFGEIQGREGHRVLAAFPLRVGGRNIGALFFFWTTPQQIGPRRLNLGRAIADQVAVAVENARLYSDARRRTTTLEVLNEISRAINSTLDLEALFRITVEQARRVIPCERCSIYKLESDKRVISRIYAVDDVEERKDRVPPISMSGSEFEQILDARKTVYLPDARKDPHPRRQVLAAEGLRSIINVPILSEGECIGFLNVLSSEVDAYTEAHIDLLRSVADHLATAMKNAELYSESRQRATTLEVLDEIAKAINSTLDLGELFKITAEQMKRVIPCDECVLYILGADKMAVSEFLADSDEEARKEWLETRRNLAGTQYEHILRTKEPLYTPDARESPHPRIRSLAAKGLRSCINAPILVEGECIGFWNSGSPEVNAFTKEHIELQASVADHLALALKNAALYAQVRETGERLDNFVRGAAEGIITVDLSGRVTSWNPGAEAIYGYAEGEVIGRKILDLFPDNAEELRSLWEPMMSGKAVPTIKVVRRRKDGTQVDVSITLSPLKDAGGRFVGASGIQRDITERRRAEEVLRKSERNYRTLFERASDAIEIIDEEGRIIDCNQKACSMLGYAKEELLGRPLSEFVAPEHRGTLPQRIARIVDRGLDPYESVNVRKDGTRVPLEVSPGFIEMDGKNRIIFFLRDITERKQAQEALMRSQKLAALGRLSAGMAHEILNPTNIIGLIAQILSKEAKDPDSVRKSAESIRLNVGRIAKICDSLRRFSREEASSISRFDLAGLIQETVSMVSLQVRLEEQSVSLELPEASVPIEADRDQIAQVLLNLIGNARDAMPGGGRITVRLEEIRKDGAPWVCLSVHDEGEGIPQERLSQIFDPFFTTKDEDKGTGLGLSIVHGIVEGHGGTIDVQSRVGRGSAFRVALPCSQPETASREGKDHPRKAVGRA